MTLKNHNEVKPDESETANQSVDTSKRSFAKASVVAPVMLTLASKPVLGNVCSYSGIMSGNLSSPNVKPCEGCTPGYWKNHPSMWPAPYIPAACLEPSNGNPDSCPKSEYDNTGTKFGAVFGIGYRGSSTQDASTMIVLIDNPNGNWTLHAHAIAALLNAASGINFGNSVTDVINWWRDSSISDLDLKNRYAMLNERLCPLGNGGSGGTTGTTGKGSSGGKK